MDDIRSSWSAPTGEVGAIPEILGRSSNKRNDESRQSHPVWLPRHYAGAAAARIYFTLGVFQASISCNLPSG